MIRNNKKEKRGKELLTKNKKFIYINNVSFDKQSTNYQKPISNKKEEILKISSFLFIILCYLLCFPF